MEIGRALEPSKQGQMAAQYGQDQAGDAPQIGILQS
jgi:hypothetical protein